MELSPFSIRLKHPKASLLSSLFDLELRHKKDREKLDSWGLGDMDYPGTERAERSAGLRKYLFCRQSLLEPPVRDPRPASEDVSRCRLSTRLSAILSANSQHVNNQGIVPVLKVILILCAGVN